MGARPHRGHRHLLADGPRDQEEGKVPPGRLEVLQRIQSAVGGKSVVGEDQVPSACHKRLLEGPPGLHPLMDDLKATRAQLTENEKGVLLDVLDHQDPEWFGHGRGPRGLATPCERDAR